MNKKVVCIDIHSDIRYNEIKLKLTEEKIYEVIETVNIPFSVSRMDDGYGLLARKGPFFKIVNDIGDIQHFPAWRFRDLTLNEIRDLKLDELI
jgi:hypothetical protein